MADTITSIAALLDALGGDAEIAKKYGVSKKCVAMWRFRQHISNAFHLRIYAETKRKGINVSPDLFGLDEEEAQGLFRSSVPFQGDALPQNVIRLVANKS